MTEQMEIALDKAAVGAQWADGRILLHKDTLQPADLATTPIDKLVSVPVPDKLYIAVHFGAKWYIKNVWHDAEEKPQSNKECLVVTHPNNACMVMTSNSKHFELVKMWAYIDDLLPIESDIPEQK